ncbi:uncharacterized protein B0H18DRAFT_893336, partial [Fomitopsis serialis]|uniref:uncharacterized protein n=1 Tax=Fomitopsis serialis TaxID=139415 RepID=UPI0020084D9F
AAMMTIVDTSGVHYLPVRWCGCLGAKSHTLQMLDCGLYPASQREARTCFTFQVLDDFLLDNLECKTTAMNYYRRIRRLTDPLFPHEVPDRYRELARVSRQWTLLQAKKEFGYGPAWRGPPGDGDLAHFCAACPQPGINIPDDWQVDDREYLYARGYAMDGNFHAEQMKMRVPGNDVPLMPGKMFMVNPTPYAEHLKVAKEVVVKSTCNDHKAVSQANADRHKLAVTGIGATACSRHGCFVPHSVVNFQKGERQMNMDYSLSNALKYRSRGCTRVIVLYDIMCQWGVHMNARFEHSPYLSIPPRLVLYKCIGLFHVHGHKPECEYRFSPTYMIGAGEVDGEIVETQWSCMNRISGSTRTMSTSHRQETLDRHMNDWNWKKMITMVTSLRRKIKANRPVLADMKRDLSAKEAGVSPLRLQAWKAELDTAQRQRLRNVKVMDRYQPPKQIAPSQAALQLELTEQEGDDDATIGTAAWIAEGLKLEEIQLRRIKVKKHANQIGDKATGAQLLKLGKERKNLETRIRRFHSRAHEIARRNHFVVGEGSDNEDDEDNEWEDEGPVVPRQPNSPWAVFSSRPPPPYSRAISEETALGLPSNLPMDVREEHGIALLASREIVLRRGQANDSLQQLRVLLGQKSFQFRTSVRHGKGNTKRTRAWTSMTKLDRAVQIQAAVYRRARAAMLVLGMTEADRRKYQPLQPDDLKVSTAIAEPNKRGQRHKSPSWVWNVDVEGDIIGDNGLAVIHRVHWFQARSKVDRLQEEAGLLKRELDSVRRYFTHESKRWRDMAGVEDNETYPGFRPYCRRRAAMFERLHRDAQQTFMDMYIDSNAAV